MQAEKPPRSSVKVNVSVPSSHSPGRGRRQSWRRPGPTRPGPDAYVPSVGAIQPTPEREYPVVADWRNQRYPFTLVFSERFCSRVRDEHAAVDLERGELVMEDGARHDMLGARRSFEQATGAAAPPWLFRLPNSPRAFVLPRGPMRLDEERGRITIEPPQYCIPIFRCYEGPWRKTVTFEAEECMQPLSSWQPRERRLASSVTIQGETLADISRVRDAFFDVAGRRGERWLAERPGLARDVVILVSPGGKHFSALPELSPFRAKLAAAASDTDTSGMSFDSQALLSAATILTEHVRYVCVASDDLALGGISARHELFHLLESEMLAFTERRYIDDWYRRTVENAGPFARPYGFLRREFLPTLGEMVQGAAGAEGRLWLRAHHREAIEWLRHITHPDLAHPAPE